ncbi:membrane protein [Labrys miyagiensis]|uniref:Small-conductance mechanosensitive channel n=1 Tax=Labrys miyagiensis TaxID=346912 RepID=A0ABQ6CSL8_9HYPH|nr:mechanosensitive ion channel family protein [Labrys miyagiensis]GLS22729.1 membrane protein [Labrys miyagiensis]
MFGDHHSFALALINSLGLAGIIVWHLQGRRRPLARLIVQILFFAGMSAVLGVSAILPYRIEAAQLDGIAAFLAMSARVLWWTHLAWAMIGLVRLYILLRGTPKDAHLPQDLLVSVVYLTVALSIMAFVFGAPIGTLVATSGVVAIIVGLALQNTLGDVFSGIALTLGRPYAIGDWVVLSDGTEGRIVETNWRATHLLTGAHNVAILPNSVLAKVGLTNLSRPDESHGVTLTVRIAATSAPHVIEGVLRTVLQACERIVKEPPPAVALKAIDAVAVEADLLFRVASPASRIPATNEVIDLLHHHCRADRLCLAMPPQSYLYAPHAPGERSDTVPAGSPSAGAVQHPLEAAPPQLSRNLL